MSFFRAFKNLPFLKNVILTPSFTSTLAKFTLGGIGVVGGMGVIVQAKQQLFCVAESEHDKILDAALNPKDGHLLPEYTLAEISSHSSREAGVWVIIGEYIYDVTDFLDTHPGGDRILLAAGQQVEPFWSIYPIHYASMLVPSYLHKFRIGRVDKADMAKVRAQLEEAKKNDPFGKDPVRHPILFPHQKKPFNGEPPNTILGETYITPNNLWFTRNHHPVPIIDEESYRLEVGFEYGRRQFLSLDDLKSYPPIEATVTIVCAGNRRIEMNEIDKTEGLPWTCGALSTAVFRGVPLRTILQEHGLTEENARHDKDVSDVIVVGKDAPFECSIPIEKAISAYGDVMLAYEMNGEPIPIDHGFPVRFIVPGHVGVRNVKWATKVIFSDHEAQSPWQIGTPYKGFSPSLKSFDGVDVAAIPSVQTLPIMSSITEPVSNALLYPTCEEKMVPIHPENPRELEKKEVCTVDVQGWAYAGGGRGIVRVDVSGNDGKDWTTAEVVAGPSKLDIEQDKAWAWTLWKAEVPVDPTFQNKPITNTTLAVKAIDTGYNVQPETVAPIWNRRGILNNSWHRVQVRLSNGEDEDDEGNDLEED